MLHHFFCKYFPSIVQDVECEKWYMTIVYGTILPFFWVLSSSCCPSSLSCKKYNHTIGAHIGQLKHLCIFLNVCNILSKVLEEICSHANILAFLIFWCNWFTALWGYKEYCHKYKEHCQNGWELANADLPWCESMDKASSISWWKKKFLRWLCIVWGIGFIYDLCKR